MSSKNRNGKHSRRGRSLKQRRKAQRGVKREEQARRPRLITSPSMYELMGLPLPPWVKQSYLLLEGYRQEISRTGEPQPELRTFILVASDYLEMCFGPDADWSLFDVNEALEMFGGLLASADCVRDFLWTMIGFFTYLRSIGRVEAGCAADVIEQVATKLELAPSDARFAAVAELVEVLRQAERAASAPQDMAQLN